MSYYYKYNFVSPEPVYANVKEELRSYFDTGQVDDLMFPIWTQKCLDTLGKGSYQINETYLEVDGYQAKLPSDFVSVREAWICATVSGPTYKLPGAYYKSTTMRLTPHPTECLSEEDCNDCATCPPDLMSITYKTTGEVVSTFKVVNLLTPGNITRNSCSTDLWCANYGANSLESYDVVGNKFVTNFASGSVYLIYYSNEVGDCGNQMIPDNFRIKEYIECFLKFKTYEQLFNSVGDETFNQIQSKYMYYKQVCDEARVMAQIEAKKETIYDKMRAIKRSYNRHNRYNID